MQEDTLSTINAPARPELEIDFGDVDIDEVSQIEEYDLTSSPNDFNVITIVDFIKSGAVKIPGFQRNYVWDIKRASKLIESILIGLPVPQVFLYEEARNSFLVIDGQQRLMTLFYFVRGRFPKKSRRSEIRKIIDENGGQVPEELFDDDEFFEKFSLRLPEIAPGKKNRFHRLTYDSLGEYESTFKLRTIRNVIVKQVRPSGDDSSIYEMFNRLNTGGVLLTPQEIRSSLYHSPFYDEMMRLNLVDAWRNLIGSTEPDLHMRDIEVMLRLIALTEMGDSYSSSMVKFLNTFSKHCKELSKDDAGAYIGRFERTLAAVAPVPRECFANRQGRLSLPVLESIFVAAAHGSEDPEWSIDVAAVKALVADGEFHEYVNEGTTNKANVEGRLSQAKQALVPGT